MMLNPNEKNLLKAYRSAGAEEKEIIEKAADIISNYCKTRAHWIFAIL